MFITISLIIITILCLWRARWLIKNPQKAQALRNKYQQKKLVTSKIIDSELSTTIKNEIKKQNNEDSLSRLGYMLMIADSQHNHHSCNN